MTDGLMTRFAIVAHKSEVFDAHGAKAKLLGSATVGAFAVGRQTSQLAHFLFCRCQGHCVEFRFAGRSRRPLNQIRKSTVGGRLVF